MSQPVPVDILSDSDDDRCGSGGGRYRRDAIDLSTPLPVTLKKRRTELDSNPTVFVIDDDQTPGKPSLGLTASASTPSFVPETPFSDLLKPDCSIVKCSNFSSSISYPTSPGPSVVEETPISEKSRFDFPVAKCTKGTEGSQDLASSVVNNHKFSGTSKLICLDSDNESEDGSEFFAPKKNDSIGFAVEMDCGSKLSTGFIQSTCFLGNADIMEVSASGFQPTSFRKDASLDHCCPSEEIDRLEPFKNRCPSEEIDRLEPFENCGPSEEIDRLEPFEKVLKPNSKTRGNSSRKNKVDEEKEKKRILKEERLRLKEEKKKQKEQEKMQKAAQKAEAIEMKKLQKEKQKWENGKLALKSIVALIDTRVVELGSIGGHLITRLAEKGLSYRITTNPIEKSILWTMAIPEQLSEIASEPVDIRYVLLVYEAEEFCNLVLNGSFLDHASKVRSLFPLHTLCFLTNRLMSYINKREHAQYKDPSNKTGWKRPPIEEVLAKLTTQFVGVHSRQCIDEAEVAEHIVGLTSSLASCQYRKKLSRLSVNANGSLVPKDCVDKNLIKKSPWLKALVAIPKVQPRFAIAIWKKYPTMKSLLSVYMDPNKSVHEKEFLLSDLRIEGLLGDTRRLGDICSKRVYRILMAQSGGIKTDDIECGADFFGQPSV
nr:crossover junction endonuclease EME1B-like [Ipomoea trifida]